MRARETPAPSATSSNVTTAGSRPANVRSALSSISSRRSSGSSRVRGRPLVRFTAGLPISPDRRCSVHRTGDGELLGVDQREVAGDVVPEPDLAHLGLDLGAQVLGLRATGAEPAA